MLDMVKQQLRIDGSEEDALLQLLIDSAKEYLLRSGVRESDTALYKTAVITHVLLSYENRDKTLNVWSLESVLRTAILQLRDYGGDPDESIQA